MSKLFYWFLLLTLTTCASYIRLSTTQNQQTQLSVGDSIISTLGLAKATLRSSKCTLEISAFNNKTNSYDIKGSYQSPSITSDCTKLIIKDAKVVTEAGTEYLALVAISNYSTTLTIDEQAVIRLIVSFISQDRRDIVSKQVVIDRFRQVPTYVRSRSQLVVEFGDSFEPVVNQRGWAYVAEIGQLTIFYAENPSMKLEYIYSSLTIRDSRIYDFDNQTFPMTLFRNITMQPRCSGPKMFLDFKPPYTFSIDPYWPIFTLYEQGGYKVISLALSKLPQFNFNQKITDTYFFPFYSPCPRKTFEHQGDCINSCPLPYYHLIKGEAGFCVLQCEEFSIVNEVDRTCSCVTQYEENKLSSAKLVRPCDPDSRTTPYGCECTQPGMFYDGLFTFSCVSTCPNATVGFHGVCMLCPYNCHKCGRDSFNREFLECTTCKKGYSLYQGQCVQTCLTNYGNSIVNGSCVKCNDVHCVDCSTDPAICLKCDLFYTLQKDSTCSLVNTNAAQVYIYSNYFSTTALQPSVDCGSQVSGFYNTTPFVKCDECPFSPNTLAFADKCVDKCPANFRAADNYCVCANTNLTEYNMCLNQTACPINSYYDFLSSSCLACPIGCVSCLSRHCLACNPGFTLYVSFQITMCRRRSPLVACGGQYRFQRNTSCLPINYTDPSLQMILCYSKIPNCMICLPRQSDYCLVCQVGFQIFNNTCLKQCPAGLLKYDNTCLQPQISQCSVPHLRSNYKYYMSDIKLIGDSKAYQAYILKGSAYSNDPISYMIYFQNITSGKTDGFPRETSFFVPDFICLKCNDGYGLSDDFKMCLPCPPECIEGKCYMAKKYSCLTTYKKPINTNCSTGYIDEQTGNCLASCSSADKYPEMRQGQLYCVLSSKSTTKNFLKVDSALYPMKDGSNLVFFVFSEELKNNNQQAIVQGFSSTKVQQNISEPQPLPLKSLSLQQTSPTSTNIQSLNSAIVSQLALLSKSSVLQIPIDNNPNGGGSFVGTIQPFPGFILDLSQSLTNLTGVTEPVVLPSKVYGTVVNFDHTAFMKTWLAYIGYIMSIVIILLHAVFIGNQLLYKIDNLLIFVQTIFYFSYAKNLVGRLLAQFYFGWSFAHARFLPNLFSGIIPDRYVEYSAPVSYKLVNIDGNYFRNAGFSLAWLLIFIAVFFTITFVVWVIFKLCGKREIWYPRVATQSIAASFEFFAMNLIFFSVSQLDFSNSETAGEFLDYYERSKALAIISIVVIAAYTIIRIFVNPIGGLYMFKRCLIAATLVFSYSMNALIVVLIAIQVLFSIFRHFIQSPTTKWQKISIWAECILLIGNYFLLFFCLDAGVNTIIISIFVFLFIVYLTYDLTTIYLESRNEFPEEQLAKDYEELASQMNRERANTVNNDGGNRNPAGSMFAMENQ